MSAAGGFFRPLLAAFLFRKSVFVHDCQLTIYFIVIATGNNLKYQWQYCTTNSTSWKNTSLSGNKTSTLSMDIAPAIDGQRFRCKVTDSTGAVIYSNPAALTVLEEDDEYSI